MPVATAFSGTLTMVAQGLARLLTCQSFLANTPETRVWERDKWPFKDLETTGFIQHQYRLRELPPKAECPGFVLGITLYHKLPTQTAQILPSPGSSSSSVVRTTKITDTEAVIDGQKLLTQDKGRESKVIVNWGL